MTTTLHLHRPMAYPMVDFNLSRVLPGKAARAAAADTIKNVALFAAAPFIGLAYAVLLPWVAIAMLVWMGAKAIAKAPAARRVLITTGRAAAFVTAPLIGLAYVVLLPFLGVALIAYTGFKAYRAPRLTA